jgi:hypothetical protein
MAIVLNLDYNIFTKKFYKGWPRKCLGLDMVNLIILILKNGEKMF